MNRAKDAYIKLLSIAGIEVLVASVFLAANTRIGSLGILLLVLAVVVGWTRINLEPSGYVSLAPFVSFISLLLAEPFLAVLTAVVSAIVSSRFASQRSSRQMLEEVGEQGIAALIAAAFVQWGALATVTADLSRMLFIFLISVVAYASSRLALAAISANLSEGIRVLSFLQGAGRYMVAHHIFLGLGALGLTYLDNRVGILALPLAVIALIEFYYPARLISEQRSTMFASLGMIAQAIDLKDTYTAKHSRSVVEMAVRIARTMGLPEKEIREIRIGALLHDIGKVGVSGKIIRKPAALDSAEQLKMREHPVISAEILQPVEFLSNAAEIVRHHHEHYDGSGYPDGLRGEEIPIGSRIILVADAYDAIISDRPYRRGRSKVDALRVLKDHAGRQFDTKVVRVLESIIDLV